MLLVSLQGSLLLSTVFRPFSADLTKSTMLSKQSLGKDFMMDLTLRLISQ